MLRPDQSAKRGKGSTRDVEVIWECCPSVSAQAEALLVFLRVDSKGASTSRRSFGWQP